MITYAYWAVVLFLACGALFLLGSKGQWQIGAIAGAVLLVIGASAYYFHFEQVFVKKYGGVMSIKVPEGQRHIAATWKDENLWIENYDPTTNTCHFSEYSKGNLLQGKVTIKNCNPVAVGEISLPTK